MLKRVTMILLFIVIVLFIFSGVEGLQSQPRRSVLLANNTADLTGFDFSSGVVTIDGEPEYYPNRLYAPEDFAGGGLDLPARGDPNLNTVIQYGTYRFTVKLPPGVTYAATGNSNLFSMRLYINGALAAQAGTPAETKAETIPQTVRYTAFFTPETDTTEFVIQYANFNHHIGGGTYPITIGRAETVARMNEKATLDTFIRMGCMLTIFLFYLGLFILYKREWRFLMFALCCLFVGLAAFWSGGRTVSLFLPGLSWFVSIRVEYLISIFTLVFFTAFLRGMQPGLLNKWIVRVYYAYSGVYALLVLVTEPRFFTGLLLYFQIGVGLFFLYIFWRLFKNLRKCRLEETLLFAGVAVYLTSSILEAFFNSFSNWLGIRFLSNISQSGMMVFIFINMMALALQFYGIEADLLKTRLRETELTQTNNLLERLSQVRMEFFNNISHEMRTPLTVMSTSAQMTRKKLQHGAKPEEIYRNLELISSEAKRLADMVSEILHLSQHRESTSVMVPVHLDALIRETAAFYADMLEANGNRFTLQLPANLPPVYGNADLLKQVLVNAVANANNHTQNGEITITAATDGDMQIVTVADTGSGIAPELLPHVFERYHTGKAGGTGLGLSISKKIIELHGGRIGIENTETGGAALTFTLPLIEGGQSV